MVYERNLIPMDFFGCGWYFWVKILESYQIRLYIFEILFWLNMWETLILTDWYPMTIDDLSYGLYMVHWKIVQFFTNI